MTMDGASSQSDSLQSSKPATGGSRSQEGATWPKDLKVQFGEKSPEKEVNEKSNEKSAGENFIDFLVGSLRDNSKADSATPQKDMARHFGAEQADTGLNFASSSPATMSTRGGSTHGSGSTDGSRSGSSESKHSNEDHASGGASPLVEPVQDPPLPSSRYGGLALDPNQEMPPLPLSNFPREMVDCLRELLTKQNGAAEVPQMPEMQDPFGFQGLTSTPAFEMPAEQQAPAVESNSTYVQYVPVPCITTPFGLCMLPLPPYVMPPPAAQPGYAYPPTASALEKAAAACPEGFTLKPTAEVYKAYPNLQQKTASVTPGETTAPAKNGAAGGKMLEQLLPNGRQREARHREDTNRKVFVGGLNPSTTAEGIRAYFERFGTVSEATVVIDNVTRTSRRFGFVVFEGEIPAGLLDMQHVIESRRCGVRDYGNARENEA